MDEDSPEFAGLLTPSEAVYATVGRIALHWSYLEYMIEVLIWRYTGDVDIGHVFTSQMGNQALTEVLEALAAHEESDETGRDIIAHAIEGFHILRLNRNKLVHSFNFFEAPGSGIRFSGRKKVRVFDDFDEYTLSLDDLSKQVEHMMRWSWFLHQTVDAVSDRRFSEIEDRPDEWRPWPKKPPLPGKLLPLRPVAHKSKRPPPRSSQG